MTKSTGKRAAQRRREELLSAGDTLDRILRHLADRAQFARRMGADAVAGDYMDAFWIIKRAIDRVRLELREWPVGGIGLGDLSGRR